MKSSIEEKYNLNYFNFKEFKDKCLITNDLGRYAFLDRKDLKNLISKDTSLNKETAENLEKNFFIYRDKEEFLDKASKELGEIKGYLNAGTQLHIFVLTTYCNFNCIYCQASASSEKGRCESSEKFMTKETAEKAVDIAMQSVAQNITFEFQGGEPLANFEVLKHIIEYSKERNKEYCKDIEYSLVSNLTLADDEIISYLLENNVGISTSIDGPEELQNINRKYTKGNSFKTTTEKIKKINNKAKTSNRVQAIETTSKFSLKYPKEIVDEYINLGMHSVFIRPLTPMGYAAKNWTKIGYSVEEFLDFYRRVLDYIIEKSREGINISEGHAVIFLRKILKNEALNYMELRSPCGGAIGQLAYNYDGNIYTCDEGRMLSEMGDESFKVGNVFENNLKDLIQSPVCKSVAVSSCLESIPGCQECVYSPYCGVCPVCNYGQYGNLFAPNPHTYRCEIYKGILNCLFEKIYEGDEEIMAVFYRWIN